MVAVFGLVDGICKMRENILSRRELALGNSAEFGDHFLCRILPCPKRHPPAPLLDRTNYIVSRLCYILDTNSVTRAE